MYWRGGGSLFAHSIDYNRCYHPTCRRNLYGTKIQGVYSNIGILKNTAWSSINKVPHKINKVPHKIYINGETG